VVFLSVWVISMAASFRRLGAEVNGGRLINTQHQAGESNIYSID
jgi:hypothetical protein